MKVKKSSFTRTNKIRHMFEKTVIMAPGDKLTITLKYKLDPGTSIRKHKQVRVYGIDYHLLLDLEDVILR